MIFTLVEYLIFSWSKTPHFNSTESVFTCSRLFPTILVHRFPNDSGLRGNCHYHHAYESVQASSLDYPYLFLQSKSLKPLHNYVHTCLTYVSVGTDVLRLYAGFTSNDRDDVRLVIFSLLF